MQGKGPKSPHTGVPGWYHSQEEEDKLIELARFFAPKDKPGHIVELGGEYGRSAAAFAFALQERPNITIWTVDRFAADGRGDVRAIWRENLAQAKLKWGKDASDPPYNSAIRATSWEGVDEWTVESGAKIIDLLYIDAGHTYADVIKDINAWTPLANVVVFHDYAKNDYAHPLHLEVKRAVDEKMTEDTWKRHDAPTSMVYFVRHKPINATKKRSSSSSRRKSSSSASKRRKTAKSSGESDA